MYFLKKYRRGIFVKYRKHMPVTEMLLKDINYLLLKISNFFANNFSHKTLLVYPHYPSRGSALYKISRILKYNITNKPGSNYNLAVYWEYLTFREEFHFLESIADETKVINLHSRDISKVFVDKAFKKVFGYSTFIDPKSYTGKIVKKNDINAIHDGTILQGPVKTTEDGFIYQILINNAGPGDTVIDIRVPIVNGTIDFVYEKFKPVDNRFGHPSKSVVRKIEDMLSTKEIELLNKLCDEMQLEFGEMDVLRNKDDGKIYVIDVNNTPQFQRKLIKEDEKTALHKIAAAFRKEFLS